MVQMPGWMAVMYYSLWIVIAVLALVIWKKREKERMRKARIEQLYKEISRTTQLYYNVLDEMKALKDIPNVDPLDDPNHTNTLKALLESASNIIPAPVQEFITCVTTKAGKDTGLVLAGIIRDKLIENNPTFPLNERKIVDMVNLIATILRKWSGMREGARNETDNASLFLSIEALYLFIAKSRYNNNAFRMFDEEIIQLFVQTTNDGNIIQTKTELTPDQSTSPTNSEKITSPAEITGKKWEELDDFERQNAAESLELDEASWNGQASVPEKYILVMADVPREKLISVLKDLVLPQKENSFEDESPSESEADIIVDLVPPPGMVLGIPFASLDEKQRSFAERLFSPKSWEDGPITESWAKAWATPFEKLHRVNQDYAILLGFTSETWGKPLQIDTPTKSPAPESAEKPAPEPENSSEDWTCAGCGQANSPEKNVCISCGLAAKGFKIVEEEVIAPIAGGEKKDTEEPSSVSSKNTPPPRTLLKKAWSSLTGAQKKAAKALAPFNASAWNEKRVLPEWEAIWDIPWKSISREKQAHLKTLGFSETKWGENYTPPIPKTDQPKN